MSEVKSDSPGFNPPNLEKFLDSMESTASGFKEKNAQSIASLRKEAVAHPYPPAEPNERQAGA